MIGLNRLLNFKAEKELSLASHLPHDILVMDNFKKMKVSLAVKLLSRATGKAIRFLVEYHGRPKKNLATAFFVNMLVNGSI